METAIMILEVGDPRAAASRTGRPGPGVLTPIIRTMMTA
jgi:hypothetical protein